MIGFGDICKLAHFEILLGPVLGALFILIYLLAGLPSSAFAPMHCIHYNSC